MSQKQKSRRNGSVFRNEWKWKHSTSRPPMEHNEGGSKGQGQRYKSLHKKKKNLHICNLATHMKAQEQRKQIILPKSR